MPMYKQSLLILLGVVAIVIAIGFYEYSSTTADATPTEVSAPMEETAQASQATDKLTVYVCGEVNNPGVISLPGNSLIKDAIEACGNFTPRADSASVNLAQKLQDGMKIQIKASGATTVATGTNAHTDGDKINLNTASKEQLQKLPGIGPAMAQRILDYRQEHGEFKTPQDLTKVKGIGKAKFSKLKDKIRL